MWQVAAGDLWDGSGIGTNPAEVQVLNNLRSGAIDAHIFKAGQLLASKTSIAPGQTAAFQFESSIWIGVARQIVEGQVMSSAILSSLNTEISLCGVKSADIVMTDRESNSRPPTCLNALPPRPSTL